MGKKILIAEDEKSLASVLSLKLIAAGFETKIVYDGEDALTALKGDSFDLLLIDLMMPKRDGFSVLEEMKKTNITTPAIVMSNLGQREDIMHVKNLGIKDYIIKEELSPTEIVTRVSTFIIQK